MTAGVIEARQEFELRVGEPPAGSLQLQCEGVAPVPEKKITRAGEHAHAPKPQSLAHVAFSTVCGM